MNTEYFDGLIIPMITTACLCVGHILKTWLPMDNKYIPTILFIVGAISGILLFGINYEAVVKGMVSGLAAVGLHQSFKQYLKLSMGEDEFYAMGKDEYEKIGDYDGVDEDELTDDEITIEEEYQDVAE